MTQNLIRMADMLKQFPVTDKTIRDVLTKRGVLPAYVAPGKGGMMLYDTEAAIGAMTAFMEARKPKPKPVLAPAPTGVLPSTDSISAAQLAVILKSAHEQHTIVEQLANQVSAISQAQAVLLKTLERVGIDVSNKVDALQQTLDDFEPDDVAPPSTVVQLKPMSSKPSKKVVIVGLFDAHAAHIEREFKDVFDLTIYNIDDAKGQGFVGKMQAADHVICMIKFVNHSVDSLAKNAGIKMIRMTGGLSQLRDKLTELYVKEAA